MPGVPNGTVGCSGCCHHQDPEMSLLLEAQEQLRASEDAQRLAAETQAAILNALPAHVALIGPDGVILTVNESWRSSATANALTAPISAWGRTTSTPAIASAVSVTRKHTPPPSASAACCRPRRGISPSSISATRRRSAMVPLHGHSCPLSGGRQDRHAGAVVMHIDITERKQAEEAASGVRGVARPHRWARPFHVRGTDDSPGNPARGQPARAGGGWFETGRRPGQALRGDLLVGLFSESPAAVARGHHAGRARGGFPLRRPGACAVDHFIDVLIDVDFSLQVLRDEAGEVVFLVPSASVITERKQVENALRESNEKFQLLADNITDAFWIRSPDMSVVHYVSPAFERIWGRSAASLYANPQEWSDFIAARGP